MATKNQKPSAHMMQGDTAKKLPIEEVPGEELTTLQTVFVSAEERAKQEISRFNVARTWIAKRVKEYSKLVINGIDDKEGYNAVKAAWQEIRGKRLDVKKKHEDIKADYLVITRAIDGEKNELTGLLTPLEEQLKSKLDAIEEAKEAIKQKAEKEAQEKLQSRVAELLANGMSFNGSFYAIGESVSMDVVTLKNMTDAEYSKLLGIVTELNAGIIAEQQKKEREEQEQRDQLERTKKEQEDREKELQAQKEQQDKERAELEKEREQMILDRTKQRAVILESMGMKFNYSDKVFKYFTSFGTLTLPVGTVEGLSGDKWAEELEDITAKLADLKGQQAKKDAEEAEQKEQQRKDEEARQLRIKARYVYLTEIGMTRTPIGFVKTFNYDIDNIVVTNDQIEKLDHEEWISGISIVKSRIDENIIIEQKEAAKEAEEAEQKRTAALSDAQRISEYLGVFKAAFEDNPVINDPHLKKVFTSFDKTVRAAMVELFEALTNV